MNQRKKILIIDDERPTLKMFSLLLEHYGYDILTAENGQSGLELFKQERPHIVMTDIKMPIMDGIEVLKEIKKVEAHTEVIVITGHGDMELAIQALNLDATDFINKPVKRKALEQALTRAVERFELAKDAKTQVFLEDRQTASVISIQGNVTGNTLPHITKAIEQAQRCNKGLIILNFDENASINGAGLTGLTDVLNTYRDIAGRIVLAGLSRNFRTVFEMVGITKLVALFDDEDAALKTH